MSTSFRNLWFLSILKFFIFICCTIHTVHGDAFNCVSPTPMPTRMFNSENYDNLGYVRDSVVELARIFHQNLGLIDATDDCIHLATLHTSSILMGQTIPYRHSDDADEHSVELLEEIENMAKKMFNYFKENAGELRRGNRVVLDYEIAINEGINQCIYRLTITGYYLIEAPLVVEIRKLKWFYSDESGPHFGVTIAGVRQTEPPSSTRLLFHSYKDLLLNDVMEFMQPKVTTVVHSNIIYVNRGDRAISDTEDPHEAILGSDFAIDSIIFILTHADTPAIGIANICESEDTDEMVNDLVEKVDASSSNTNSILSLYLIGGHTNVEKLFYSIMDSLHNREENIHLRLVCTGIFNTTTQDGVQSARITGAAISTHAKEVFSATFFPEDRNSN